MNSTPTRKGQRRMARQPNSKTATAQGANQADDASRAPDEKITEAKKPNKTEAVITLLNRERGATLDELVEATGWQPHSARAALTGLKKKGHAIERTRVNGVSRYAIVEPVSQ